MDRSSPPTVARSLWWIVGLGACLPGRIEGLDPGAAMRSSASFYILATNRQETLHAYTEFLIDDVDDNREAVFELARDTEGKREFGVGFGCYERLASVCAVDSDRILPCLARDESYVAIAGEMTVNFDAAADTLHLVLSGVIMEEWPDQDRSFELDTIDWMMPVEPLVCPPDNG